MCYARRSELLSFHSFRVNQKLKLRTECWNILYSLFNIFFSFFFSSASCPPSLLSPHLFIQQVRDCSCQGTEMITYLCQGKLWAREIVLYQSLLMANIYYKFLSRCTVSGQNCSNSIYFILLPSSKFIYNNLHTKENSIVETSLLLLNHFDCGFLGTFPRRKPYDFPSWKINMQ